MDFTQSWGEVKHYKLAKNENDASWEDFFPLAEHSQKRNGWPMRLAQLHDGNAVEVYFPTNDIAQMKFHLQGG